MAETETKEKAKSGEGPKDRVPPQSAVPSNGAKINQPVIGEDGTKQIEIVVKEKVAIIGFAPASMQLAPYKDPEWDIWGTSEVYLETPRVPDRIFELHPYERLSSKKRNPNHLEWLRNAKIPIFMQEAYEDIPMSIRFPVEDVKNVFPHAYFNNTISWLMGLAYLEGAKTIGLFGVDMAADSEYGSQRPSCEYAVGWLQGKGIEVIIPPESDLLKSSHLYGFEQKGADEFTKRMRAEKGSLNQRARQHEANWLQERDAMNQCIGGSQVIDRVLQQYQSGEDK